MFSGPSRTAKALDTMAAPALDTQYSDRGTATATALEEETLTMAWVSAASRGRASSRLAKLWQRKNIALVFTAMQRSKLSSSTSSGSPRRSTPTPAL